jgi:hypothetical protein
MSIAVRKFTDAENDIIRKYFRSEGCRAVCNRIRANNPKLDCPYSSVQQRAIMLGVANYKKNPGEFTLQKYSGPWPKLQRARA